MSSPGAIDGSDKEETYVSLDGTLGGAQPTGPVRLETPPSQSQWFTQADNHVWVPLVHSGVILLGGHFALRYARNTRLLRRRRVLLGVLSVGIPARNYLGMRVEKQEEELVEGHPAYEAWCWTTATFLDRKLGNSLQQFSRMIPLDSDIVAAERRIEQRFLDSESRGEYFHADDPGSYYLPLSLPGLATCMLDRSRFMWSTPQQRAYFLGIFTDAMIAARVPFHDTVLFAAHTCLVANRSQYAPQWDLMSRGILAAALGFGFVVESPIAVALVGTVGVCSLAHQLVIAILDLHVVSDVWMYHEPLSIARMISTQSSMFETTKKATQQD